MSATVEMSEGATYTMEFRRYKWISISMDPASTDSVIRGSGSLCAPTCPLHYTLSIQVSPIPAVSVSMRGGQNRTPADMGLTFI